MTNPSKSVVSHGVLSKGIGVFDLVLVFLLIVLSFFLAVDSVLKGSQMRACTAYGGADRFLLWTGTGLTSIAWHARTDDFSQSSSEMIRRPVLKNFKASARPIFMPKSATCKHQYAMYARSATSPEMVTIRSFKAAIVSEIGRA